jgi:ParB family chromosome partitioning protein
MTNGNSDNPTSNSSSANNSANRRRGLGRGLGALIVDTQKTPPPAFETDRSGDSQATDDMLEAQEHRVSNGLREGQSGKKSEGTSEGTSAGVSEGIRQLPLDQISPNPQQPRSHFDPTALEELAASIRTHGILQPLIVTMNPHQPSSYWLVAGERRWRAARIAPLESVPAIVREASPLQLMEWALVENLQRADLNPLEEATAYQALVETFAMTQAEIGQRVGKSRAAVANTIRLLQLPLEAQQALMDGRLSAGHGRALLALPDHDTMLAALAQLLTRGLSVRQTEEMVKQMLLQAAQQTTTEETENKEAAEDPASDSQLAHMENHFRSVLGTRVNLNRNRDGSGKLVVHFYSDEELGQLYQLIAGDDEF